MQTASAVIIEDLPNDKEFRYSPTLRDHGIVSVVNVPIMFDGRVWGVFEVDADQARSFDEV
ncbi:MAG: GAF domain-containing protein [Methylobacteriaceae bacterium]